jgi:Family of unknown function (DUF6399)/IclR helix-turn-helix domain
MGFWAKSVRIFKCLCENDRQGVRRIAQQTGLSKSSVHRLKQAMARRDVHPESWLWDTEEGRQWLRRLVVATLYTFGLKRGVGADTLSEFLTRLRLARHVGCSPSALRGVLHTLEAALLETARAWEEEGRTAGDVREIIGAVDETFLERLMLVFMDLPTGYLLFEEVAANRTYITWKALVEERLQGLGTTVWYMVSDRANALIQLAEQGLECFSMPDCFHVVHELAKSYSLAIGRCVRQAHQALQHAEAVLAHQQGRHPAEHDDPGVQARVARCRAKVEHVDEGQRAYRQHRLTFSLTLHPFDLATARPQTSAQVRYHLQAAVEAIEALAAHHALPARPGAMQKVRKQLPALAALVDRWWASVGQDVEPFSLSPRWRRWVPEALLPLVYWERYATQTRCARRKAPMLQALETVRVAFRQHTITQQLAPQVLAEWQAWATERVHAFQRTSSAVEGRHGALSPLHHNQRGLPQQRYKVWTVLHNFDSHAADGTTPASRFFRYAFPDLFEEVLSCIESLPQPRQRKNPVALYP